MRTLFKQKPRTLIMFVCKTASPTVKIILYYQIIFTFSTIFGFKKVLYSQQITIHVISLKKKKFHFTNMYFYVTSKSHKWVARFLIKLCDIKILFLENRKSLDTKQSKHGLPIYSIKTICRIHFSKSTNSCSNTQDPGYLPSKSDQSWFSLIWPPLH